MSADSWTSRRFTSTGLSHDFCKTGYHEIPISKQCEDHSSSISHHYITTNPKHPPVIYHSFCTADSSPCAKWACYLCLISGWGRTGSNHQELLFSSDLRSQNPSLHSVYSESSQSWGNWRHKPYIMQLSSQHHPVGWRCLLTNTWHHRIYLSWHLFHCSIHSKAPQLTEILSSLCSLWQVQSRHWVPGGWVLKYWLE